jgi:hypothetical protein
MNSAPDASGIPENRAKLADGTSTSATNRTSNSEDVGLLLQAPRPLLTTQPHY